MEDFLFTHDIYPHPRPTTSTHYPRPTIFSYTRYYRDEKLCDVWKADCLPLIFATSWETSAGREQCTRRFIAFKALGGCWSFLKLHMYIQIETFMCAITSHKKRRAKYQTEMLSRIAKQQFRYKQCFQRKNTLTVNTDDQKFNCDNADGHSQTGNRKKKSASWIQKTSGKNKSNEKRLETLFTHCRSKHLFTQTSFYCEFGKNQAEFFAFDKFTLQNVANKSECV